MEIKTAINNVFLLLWLMMAPAWANDTFDMDAFRADYESYETLATEERWVESLNIAKRLYEQGLEVFGDESEEAAALSYNYAMNLIRTRKQEDAVPVLEDTIDIYEAVFGKDAVELIEIYQLLGDSYSVLSESRKKARSYNAALEIVENHFGRESLNYAQLSFHTGTRLNITTRSTRAERYLEEAHRIFEELTGRDSSSTAYAAFELGRYYLGRGKAEESVDYFTKALAAFETMEGPMPDLGLTTHAFLVQVYSQLDQPDLATQHSLAIGRLTPSAPDQEMNPIFTVAPQYPMELAMAGEQGWARLEFDVNEDGTVSNIQAVDFEGGEAFEKSAIEAVKKFRFAPRFVDGEPVKVEGVQYVMRFELQLD
ncbi:MAG: TonB family protein [Pseudohongiellaceae bacterium]|nr:TonB family protein [Pseudohongiellaceae bacterium]